MSDEEATIGDHTHAERERGARAVGKVLGRTGSHFPTVGDLGSRDGTGRAVVIVACGDGRSAEIRAVEAEPGEATGAIAHFHHAILAVVGGERGTVGHRPTTDEVVGQVRRA